MTPPTTPTNSPTPSPAPASPGPTPRARRRRRAVLVGAVVVALLVGGGLAVGGVFDGSGADGGSGSGAAPAAKATTTVTLTTGETKVEAPLLFTKFPAGVGDQVMAGLGKYVDDGIVTALRTGKANDADLPNVVDAGVIAQLAGADRTVLFDEGLPAATGKLAVTAPPVTLTALVGADGKAVIVVATVQLDVTATNARGPVHVTRAGDLQFAPDATGAWKLTGYDLTVNRDGKGVPAPKGATTSSGTGKGATSVTTTAPAATTKAAK